LPILPPFPTRRSSDLSSACSHAEHLLFGVSSPPAAIVADVARARDRLAQASTLELLGRYDDSLAIAREVTTITEHLGYPSVHAEDRKSTRLNSSHLGI